MESVRIFQGALVAAQRNAEPEPEPAPAREGRIHANPPVDRPKRGFTFRVRGVPLDWDTDKLKSLLVDQVGSAGPIISSLALEIHGRSRTAKLESFPPQGPSLSRQRDSF